MIDPGTTAPPVVLPGTDGDEITEYDLAEYTDSGVAVLVFYPFDFSPVCSEVFCKFRDNEHLTLTKHVDVLGISTDSAYAHREFADQLDLAFPLLSDSDGAVIEAYDAMYEECEGHSEVAKRAVTIIDATNTVRHVWSSEDAYDSPDIETIFEEVKVVLREQGEWSDDPAELN